MLLVGGGNADPNLTALVAAAAALDAPIADLRHGRQYAPTVTWDLAAGTFVVGGGGTPAAPVAATAAFLRADVFDADRGAVANAWFAAVMGWVLANRGIRTLNREIDQTAFNKPAVLLLARACGLRTPPTLVTNDEQRLAECDGIAKPVAGGGLCVALDDLRPRLAFRGGSAAAPAIVQDRIRGREFRIYVVGKRAFAFELASASLDYRAKQDAVVTELPAVPDEVTGIRRLMAHLRMDFGAADLKLDERDGKLTFLELNTSPMFARFDQVAGGRLAQAMVAELLGRALS